jgi:hypothetical protein
MARTRDARLTGAWKQPAWRDKVIEKSLQDLVA